MEVDIRVKKVLCAIFLILTPACKKADDTSTHRLVYTYSSYANDVFTNHVEYYSENKKLIKEAQYTTTSDVSYTNYDYENNIIFQFGPGGLVKIDLKNETVNIVTNKNISDAFISEGNFVYVENNGFDESMTNYLCKIYSNGKFKFSVDYMINSIVYYDDKYILSNLPVSGERNFIKIYNREGKLLNTSYFDKIGTIRNIENTLYWATLENITGIENDEHLEFKNRIFSIYDYISRKDTFIFDTDKMICRYSNPSREMDRVFENCNGFMKNSESMFIVKQNNAFYYFDTTSNKKKIIKGFRNSGKHIFEEIFMY